MSFLGACLFRRVQAAPFYEQLHREAVGLLPPGAGRTWLDLGCGPGLVCRLAAARGYEVTGADSDAAMLAAARLHPASAGSAPTYRHADLDELLQTGVRADVVSAASLLVVLPDPIAGIRQLCSLVRPGGSLLIVEASEHFHLRSALRYLRTHPQPSGRGVLLLWALVRGGRSLSPELRRRLSASAHPIALLGGQVTAWVLTPSAPAPPASTS